MEASRISDRRPIPGYYADPNVLNQIGPQRYTLLVNGEVSPGGAVRRDAVGAGRIGVDHRIVDAPAAMTSYATLDLQDPRISCRVFIDGRGLTARGRIFHRGCSVLVASAKVVNADSKVVLQGTASSAVLRYGFAALLDQGAKGD